MVTRRRAVMLGGAGLAVVIAAILVATFLTRTARSEQGAVDDYVRALNAGDAGALQHDVYGLGPAEANQVIAKAKRPWVISRITVTHDFGPRIASAEIIGTAATQPLHTYLALTRKGHKWYVTAGGGLQNTPNP